SFALGPVVAAPVSDKLSAESGAGNRLLTAGTGNGGRARNAVAVEGGAVELLTNPRLGSSATKSKCYKSTTIFVIFGKMRIQVFRCPSGAIEKGKGPHPPRAFVVSAPAAPAAAGARQPGRRPAPEQCPRRARRARAASRASTRTRTTGR